MNNKPFTIVEALNHGKGQPVLAFDVNGNRHYGKLVVAYFSPMPHMILQSGDDQRIVMLNNCVSVVVNPSMKVNTKPEPGNSTAAQGEAVAIQRVAAMLVRMARA